MAKVSSIYFSRQFVLFLCTGGAALVVNLLSRMALSLVMPFAPAVILAYCVGMLTAYLLSKRFVFTQSANSRRKEVALFVSVNLAWLPVVWLLSVWLGDSILPHVLEQRFAHTVAHGFAITTPALVNFAFHKFLTFREDPADRT